MSGQTSGNLKLTTYDFREEPWDAGFNQNLEVVDQHVTALELGAYSELVAARGTRPSLDARLDIALNDDGSLKIDPVINMYFDEVIQARGSMGYLDARLDVSLNDDGTLKGGLSKSRPQIALAGPAPVDGDIAIWSDEDWGLGRGTTGSMYWLFRDIGGSVKSVLFNGIVVPEVVRPWLSGTDNELRVDPVTKCVYVYTVSTGEWTTVGESRADFSLFIDPIAGDDTAAGDIVNPVKTWNAAYSKLPTVIRHYVQINVLPGQIDWIYLSGFKIESPGLLVVFGGLQVTHVGIVTSGTTTTFTCFGAGWAINEHRGKKWEIVAGTHQYYSGRIISNTADTITINGSVSPAFDVTDQFEISVSTVLVKASNTFSHPKPLTVYNCSGSIIVYAFDFEMNQNTYQSECALIAETYGLWAYECSFKATHKAGAGSRFSLMLQKCPDVFFASCSFISEDTIVGSWSGLYLSGPNGNIQFADCVENDYLEVYYGMQQLVFSNCTRVFRPGAPQFDVYRTVAYLQLIDSIVDFALVQPGFRLDGMQTWDIRRSKVLNAAGDGFWTYSYYADGAKLSLISTEISGCTQNGINVGCGSAVAIAGATTDPLSLNGRWGVRVRNGSVLSYSGVNTITGALGPVNLGDDVTPVAHGAPATDIVNLCRMAAFGA